MTEGLSVGGAGRVSAYDVATVVGMAALWPSVHNQLMFPVTFVYNKVDAPPAYLLYLLYLACFCVACVFFWACHDRVARRLLGSGFAMGVAGVLGTLGMGLLCSCDFSSPASRVGACAGVVLVSAYVPTHFAFWGARLVCVGDGSFEHGHRVAVATCASYALFSLVTALRLALGVHAAALALAYPLATTALAPTALWLARRDGRQAGVATGRPSWRQLPWNVVGASVFFVILGVGLITLLNPVTALYDYPDSRAFAYAISVALSLAMAAVWLRTPNASRRASVKAFALLSVYLVGMILVTAVSAIASFRTANFPIIAGKNAFDLLVFVVVLVSSHNKHVNPVRFVMGFLVVTIVVPGALSASILALAGNYSDPLEGNVFILSVMVASVFLVMATATVVLVRFLAKRPLGSRTDGVVGREEGRRRERDARSLELAARAWGLTGRETDIVLAICGGAGTTAVAEELGISEATVYSHLKRVYRKADVHSRAELVTLVQTFGR